MPFTVSHVAVVVPAYRRLARLHVFSAAVIGSMAPDFGMLLPGSLMRWQTHRFTALFSFCLPVGLVAYWLTQWLIKPAVLEVLPDGPYARLRAEHPSVTWNDPFKAWVFAMLALLSGAVTHLVWDGFTHENARGVRLFPELLNYGPEMAGHSLHLYLWLQYGSSVVGLAVVAAALALWWHHAPAPAAPLPRRLRRRERRVWLLAFAVLPLAALTHVLVRWVLPGHSPHLSGDQISFVAVTAVRSAALSLLLTSALIRARLAA